MTSANLPSVVALNGSEAGTVLRIDEVLNNFVLGSDDGCHIVLSGASVSPLHATLFLDDEGTVTICDTNSLTGVFVNGAQVMEQALAEGDQISLGSPDDPQSSLLRFTTQEVDAPVVDFLPEAIAPELPSFESVDPLPAEDTLFTSELGRPEFAAEAVPFEPLPEAAPAPDEFPPMDLFAEPQPVEASPEPIPEPAPAPPPRPAAKPVPSRSASASAPRATAKKPPTDDSDDPLSGLAESLGGSGRERFVPPPAVEPVAAPTATKGGTSPAVKAARVAAVAAVLILAAWFGMRKYSESIVIPVVDSYLPNPAEPGQTVTITGSGFGTDPDPTVVAVTLGKVQARVLDANPTRINFEIPEVMAGIGTQTVSLSVTALGTTSTGRLLKIVASPKIASLEPRVALSGDEVAIAGKWLANASTRPTVTVAGNEAEVLEAGPGLVRIRVPAVSATEGQRVSVKVALGPDVGKEALLNYGRLPFVEAISPARARPGDVITLTGLGLLAPDLAVVIGGKSAAVLQATDTEIRVSLPGLRVSESAGARDLTVHANQRTSIAHPVEILRESASLYSPRFFVQMLEGSRAAVSNELGPVMVLGADPASRQRAHDAALRLNTLAATARTQRIQFIAGDVVISASGGAVLAVGPADGSGNPRALAPLWAAQLNDMFDLFFQGRRPGRTAELSPDGRVFLDMFAAARRRSAEPGVPQGLLFSPDPAWQRSLLALAASPSMGSSQALALLDGYWSGAIEVQGAPRKIEISLTATPSGLVGQRTSRQGRLSTDVTLQNLGYSRRELRFSFTDGGERLNFAGRLDGDVIAGEVTKASGGRLGRLNLQLAR